MRIERHQVGEAVIAAAREDFANRIGGQVRSMSKAGRTATYEWQSVAKEFLEYLGALSAETPSLDTPEAEAALRDATEAAVGAVSFAAYHPHCTFQVFLDYVNFGISYDPRDEDDAEEIVTPAEWIDAFCLAILMDKAKWHGEAFHFAREKFAEKAQGSPAGELATGFMAQVLDDTGEDQDYPPSVQAKLAAIDAALARIRNRAEETGESLLDRPESVALRILRAVAAEDREAFDSGLTDLLLAHTTVQALQPRRAVSSRCCRSAWPRSRTGPWAGRRLFTPTTSRTPWSPASRPAVRGLGVSAETDALTRPPRWLQDRSWSSGRHATGP
ncbi:Imm49 family immunity protein [Streptomyces sp900116325]|uniref:Imm49 family immunity protein n=1 Tax=Streptomyces sp. 900116325 TaxID=3154295 RepID=UPI0033AFEE59